MIKQAIITLLLILIYRLSNASVLDTPSYIVDIDVRCAEGEVACNNVIYTGQYKQSSQITILKGKTVHTTCGDDVTPCRFLGYSFKSGKISYFVKESGYLIISVGDNIVIEEQGQWQY